MARVAHSGMTADEVTENIEAAVQTVVAKLRMVSVDAQRGYPVPLTDREKQVVTFKWLLILPLHICELMLTERTSDEDHPHKESNVSGSAHLQLRPEPPRCAGGGREKCSDSQERGGN